MLTRRAHVQSPSKASPPFFKELPGQFFVELVLQLGAHLNLHQIADPLDPPGSSFEPVLLFAFLATTLSPFPVLEGRGGLLRRLPQQRRCRPPSLLPPPRPRTLALRYVETDVERFLTCCVLLPCCADASRIVRRCFGGWPVARLHQQRFAQGCRDRFAGVSAQSHGEGVRSRLAGAQARSERNRVACQLDGHDPRRVRPVVRQSPAPPGRCCRRGSLAHGHLEGRGTT